MRLKQLSFFGGLLRWQQLWRSPLVAIFCRHTTTVFFFFGCCDILSTNTDLFDGQRLVWVASGEVLSYGRVVDGVVVVVKWVWALEWVRFLVVWVWALIVGDGDVGVDGEEQMMLSFFGGLLRWHQLRRSPLVAIFCRHTITVFFFFGCCDILSTNTDLFGGQRLVWVASGAVLSYGKVVDGVVVVVEWVWALEWVRFLVVWVWALIARDGDVGVDGEEQMMVIPISNIFVSILGLVLWRR
ncbi:hypothetical protein LWI29_015092 [Acer saccharum]|uniref:Transmembrane protein n=1 Tax=Acer saccharum TaxID=4024 RepID=A0AA39SZP8_ACESA|nr:hypothetical protein LWI29_015092 [Acer saccharum]